MTSNELSELEKATQDLTAASNKMAETLYKNVGANAAGGAEGGPDMHAGAGGNGNGQAGGASGSGPAGATSGKKDEDVIDADFKQV